MLADPGIIAERVDHRRPARSCFLQAMNEDHRRTRGIVLLQPAKHGCICIGSRVDDSREPKPFRVFTSYQERARRIKSAASGRSLPFSVTLSVLRGSMNSSCACRPVKRMIAVIGA